MAFFRAGKESFLLAGWGDPRDFLRDQTNGSPGACVGEVFDDLPALVADSGVPVPVVFDHTVGPGSTKQESGMTNFRSPGTRQGRIRIRIS